MKLSAYTIAKNCSDLADVTAGIEEVHAYIEKCENQGKKACDRAYIRLAKLSEKREKLILKSK